MTHARKRARSLTLPSVPLLVLALAACGGGSAPPPSVADDPAPGPAVDAVAGAGLEPAQDTAQPGQVTGTDPTTPGAAPEPATTTGSSPVAPAATTTPAPAAAPPARPAAAANTGARDARVVSVTPVTRTVDHSYEVCEDGQRSYTRPPRDEHRIAGAVIGGVAGGVAGSQVGSGRGRDLATVAGAIGGAVAGRRIQEHQQDRSQQTETITETVCETVSNPVEETWAWDIQYEVSGQILSARVDEEPGERIALPVRSIGN